MSSSSLRYLSLSSSTRRRCLWRGSSCFLRASVTRTFSSASVRFSSVRTESWFSSCMKKSHTLKNNITEIHVHSANIWKLAVGMLAFLVFGALLAGVMKAAISFITKYYHIKEENWSWLRLYNENFSDLQQLHTFFYLVLEGSGSLASLLHDLPHEKNT